LVIRGGTLIDGNGGAPVANATLVISGDRIREIRTTDAGLIPPDARVIDARGKFIIPGMHEPHAHYKGWFPPLYIYYGVTSVYEIGNSVPEWILAQREMMQKEKIVGPRLFACVLNLYGRAPSGQIMANVSTFDTVEEARATARRAAELKADCLKLQSGLTGEMMLAIAQVGKEANLPLIGHLPQGMNAFRAAEVGMNHLEHSGGIPEAISKDWSEVERVQREFAKAMEGRPRDTFESTGLGFINPDSAKEDELIKALIAKNVYVEADWSGRMRNITRRKTDWMTENVALVQRPEMGFIPKDARYRWLDYSAWNSFSPELKASLTRGLENWQKFMVKFSQAGGKVVVGGEAPTVMPGLNIHRNVHLLADAGMPPMKALQAATKNVAELFRLTKDLGTLEVGKYADLMILDADPLQDIANTLKIAEVVKGGKVIDRRFSADWRNPIPTTEITRDESGYNNPDPVIAKIEPTVGVEGEPHKAVRIHGNGFTLGSVVYVDDKPVPTIFRGEQLIEATLPKDLLARVGAYAIQVVNPEPLPPLEDFGSSNKVMFLVKFK
jgi:hypothetical protein